MSKTSKRIENRKLARAMQAAQDSYDASKTYRQLVAAMQAAPNLTANGEGVGFESNGARGFTMIHEPGRGMVERPLRKIAYPAFAKADAIEDYEYIADPNLPEADQDVNPSGFRDNLTLSYTRKGVRPAYSYTAEAMRAVKQDQKTQAVARVIAARKGAMKSNDARYRYALAEAEQIPEAHKRHERIAGIWHKV
jgi:hypothetical protein